MLLPITYIRTHQELCGKIARDTPISLQAMPNRLGGSAKHQDFGIGVLYLSSSVGRTIPLTSKFSPPLRTAHYFHLPFQIEQLPQTFFHIGNDSIFLFTSCKTKACNFFYELHEKLMESLIIGWIIFKWQVNLENDRPIQLWLVTRASCFPSLTSPYLSSIPLVSSYITSPYLTSIPLVSSYITSPYLSSIPLVSSYITSPYFSSIPLVSSYITSPYLSSIPLVSSYITSPYLFSIPLVSSYITSPYLSSIPLVSSYITSPYLSSIPLVSSYITSPYLSSIPLVSSYIQIFNYHVAQTNWIVYSCVLANQRVLDINSSRKTSQQSYTNRSAWYICDRLASNNRHYS